MDVTIRGRNSDVSHAIRAAASEKISRLSRFLDGLEQAEVHFFEERNPRISEREVCEVTLRGPGQLIRAKAAASDASVAVERVVDKLEHQVQKAKSRRVRRSHPRHHDSLAPSPAQADDVDDQGDDGGGQSVKIVKAKQFSIKPMTPEEAVLQMELLAHDFYLFTNADTHRAAVVYRRNDGHVGLIDAS